MKLGQRFSTFAFCSLLLAAAVLQGDSTELKDNQYKVILDRNPFRLRPARPHKAKPFLPNVVKDVKLSGITADGASKRAWFVIVPGPGRSQPESISLTEGESAAGLRVVDIDEKDATVKILNAGEEFTLNFSENGLPAPNPRATQFNPRRRAAGFSVPNNPPVNLQRIPRQLEPLRAILVTRQPRSVVSRQGGVPTNSLLNAIQPWRLFPAQKSPPALHLAKP